MNPQSTSPGGDEASTLGKARVDPSTSSSFDTNGAAANPTGTAIHGVGSNRKYWRADYLKPTSDAWRDQVHGYRPRNAALRSIQDEFFDDYVQLVSAYGNLPIGIATTVCRNVLLTYELSPLVDRKDMAQVWNTKNVRAAAAAIRGSQTTREEFTTQMLRVAYNRQAAIVDRPVRSSKPTEKKPPYTSGELASFLAVAQTQPCQRTRWELDAFISLGAGAGACARDLRFLRTDEITIRRDGTVDALFRGKKDLRLIPVAEPWATRLRELVASRPETMSPWAIIGTRNANLILRLLDRVEWTGTQRPLLSRLRTTWIFERLLGGCRMDTLQDLLGESTFKAVGHAATFLPAGDSDRDRFRAEVQR